MKGKAVIFENDIADADLLAENLESLGFEPILVASGLEGLEAIYKDKPHLIFLNPSLSDISDYQICKLLKSKQEYRDIPIVILAERENLKFWSIKSGADDCLLKPLDRKTIGFQLQDLIKCFSKNITLTTFLDKTKQFNEVLINLPQTYEKDPALNSPEARKSLQRLIEAMATILRSEVGSLMQLDRNLNVFIIKAATGLSEEIVRGTRIKSGESISGWVAQQNCPLLVTDIEKDERFYRTNNSRYHTKSFLSVPVNFSETRGVINITDKTNKEAYTDHDLNLLLILVNQISFAFEGCKLHKRLDEVEECLKRLERINKILIEANKLLDKELHETTISDEVHKIVTADLDYHQTIKAVIEIVEEWVDFHFCGLLLVNEELQGELIISIKYPAIEAEVERFKSKVVEAFNGLTHKAISKDKIALNRADGPAIIVREDKGQDILSSFQAQLLRNKDKIMGLLAISHSKKEAFTEEDLKAFSIVVQRSTPAINNALLHRKIKELSDRDGLTGLYGYRYFQEQLDRELKRAERYQEPLSLIMLDIDGFKRINDTYGHLQGDIVLKELSLILTRICRSVDIVARYGGEEFVIILPASDRDAAFCLAERIRAVVESYDFSSSTNEPIKITVSSGVVNYPASAASKSELFKKVDIALYQAKEGGKNTTFKI